MMNGWDVIVCEQEVNLDFLEFVVASSGRFMEILQGKGSAAAGRGSTWELNILMVGTNWTKENRC